MQHRTLVVIPARNEARSVGSVVRSALAVKGCDVVVVDDASTDSTADEAHAAGARVLPLPVNLGAWGAMQTGMRHARRHGYDCVVTLDADGQHDPADIPRLLEPLRQGRAGVAIGSCTARGSMSRRVAWRFFRSLSGITLDDLTSGFRAYGADAVTVLSSRGATLLDYQDMGVLLLLMHHGFVFEEVPVGMCARTDGHSRIFSSWFVVAQYMLLTSILSLSKGARRALLGGRRQRLKGM